MAHSPQSPRMERLRSKASALIDDAVQCGEVTTSSYDPRTRTGYTYHALPTGEEITRCNDGTIFIRSDNYTDYLRVADIMLSVTIPPNGPATVVEHRTDPSQNIGQQFEREIPEGLHDDMARLILGHIASGVIEPEAA